MPTSTLSEQWRGNARDLHTHKQSGLMEQGGGRFATHGVHVGSVVLGSLDPWPEST